MLRKLLLGAAIAAISTPAFSQDENRLVTFDQRPTRANYLAEAGDAPLDQNTSAVNGIELDTNQNTTRASLRVSYTNASGGEASPTGPAPGRFTSWSATLSTPLDKEDDNTQIASLTGLSNGTTLEFGLDRLVARRARPDLSEVERLCAAAASHAGQAAASANCDDAGFNSANLSAEEYQNWLRATRGISSIWFWGLRASAGNHQFNYFDGATLAKHSTEETEWSAGAYVAFALPGRRSLVSFAVDAVDEYEAGKTQVLCPGGPPPLTCVNGPIGAPTATQRRTASLGLRHAFGDGPAIAPTLSYDFENDVYGADLPVYFLRNRDEQLTGGLRFGWQSDAHDVTVGLIVSKAFNFLSLPEG